VERCATSGRAIGAARLHQVDRNVIMLRPSLFRDYARHGVELQARDAWVFSMWSGYLATGAYDEVRRRCETVGAAVTQLHTSGHASGADLERFAAAIAPRYLVPIHSFTWDTHLERFANVHRLSDGEPFVIA
jgi:ribonuclease J